MDTAVAREEALLVYAYCLHLMSKEKRKHLRLPMLVAQHVQDKLYPHWAHLTESEKITFLYCLSERKRLNTKYVGPVWKLAMSAFWLKDKCADMAANFVINSDKHLN